MKERLRRQLENVIILTLWGGHVSGPARSPIWSKGRTGKGVGTVDELYTKMDQSKAGELNCPCGGRLLLPSETFYRDANQGELFSLLIRQIVDSRGESQAHLGNQSRYK